MLDLIIRGGDVVTPQGVGKWDVAVKGERIVAVGLPEAGVEAGRVIDAAGKVVVPGGIEPHTHLAHGKRGRDGARGSAADPSQPLPALCQGQPRPDPRNALADLPEAALDQLDD